MHNGIFQRRIVDFGKATCVAGQVVLVLSTCRQKITTMDEFEQLSNLALDECVSRQPNLLQKIAWCNQVTNDVESVYARATRKQRHRRRYKGQHAPRRNSCPAGIAVHQCTRRWSSNKIE